MVVESENVADFEAHVRTYRAFAKNGARLVPFGARADRVHRRGDLVRRSLVSSLPLMAAVALVTNAAAATLSYRQQGSITSGRDALRNYDSAIRKDSDRVRQPYPPRFNGDASRGIKGCRWLMERAIETNNRNWLQRYRACTE